MQNKCGPCNINHTGLLLQNQKECSILEYAYQPCTAGPPPYGAGHGADGADGGAAGAVGQGGHPHGHALALLGLGRTGGGEADADHLVDGGEQPELGKALEVPVRDGM